MSELPPSLLPGTPVVTELPLIAYQQTKKRTKQIRSPSNTVDKDYEGFIKTRYPSNGPADDVVECEVLAHRISATRLIAIVLVAIVTAYAVSPFSPIASFRGYDVVAAVALPTVGIIAAIWGARRLR